MPMVLKDPQITAARVRAALAYEGINVEQDGEKRTGIPKSTLRRIIAKTRPRRVCTDELRLIAAACPSVPAWFLEYGFAPPVETGETDLRLELSELRADLEELSISVLGQSGEPPADADEGLPEEPPGDGPR